MQLTNSKMHYRLTKLKERKNLQVSIMYAILQGTSTICQNGYNAVRCQTLSSWKIFKRSCTAIGFVNTGVTIYPIKSPFINATNLQSQFDPHSGQPDLLLLVPFFPHWAPMKFNTLYLQLPSHTDHSSLPTIFTSPHTTPHPPMHKRPKGIACIPSSITYKSIYLECTQIYIHLYHT